MWDMHYVTIAYSVLQMSDSRELHTILWLSGDDIWGRSKLGKTSSHTSAVNISSSAISEGSGEPKLSKNSQQRQNQINQQVACISSLEAQNPKLSQLLEPKFLVNAITQAVASNLNISQSDGPTSSSSGPGYTGKPYLGKPYPPQLAPAMDSSLDPGLNFQYCKETSYIKENCEIKLETGPGEERTRK